MQIGIVKNTKKFLGLSVVLVVLSLGVIFTKGLNYGIDFSGGSLTQIKYDKTVSLNEVNSVLDKVAKSVPQLAGNSRKVQVSEGNTVIIRTQELSEDQKETLLESLGTIGKYNIDKVEKVGASIGKELKSSAIYSLLIGSVLI